MSQRQKIWFPYAIAWLSCVLLIAAIWAITLQNIKKDRLESDQAAQRTLANLSRLTQEHASRVMRSADQTLKLIRASYASQGEAIDLAWMMGQGLIDERLFNQVGIIDAHGIYRFSNLPQTPALDLSDRAHFKTHVARDTGQVFISEPVLGRASQRWSIQMTRRINQADGSFGGVVVVSVDADYFSQFYAHLDLGDKGIAALVGLDGVVRARQVRGARRIGQHIDNPIAAPLWAQGKLEGFSDRVARLDGVRRLHYFRLVPDFPLWVTVAFGADEYRASLVVSIRNNYFQSSLLTLLLLCLTSLFCWHRWHEQRQHRSLIDSETRMNLALEGGGLSLWDWDLTSGRCEFDARMAPMLGYQPSELQVNDPSFQQRLHPEDLPRLQPLMLAVVKGQTAQFVFEHRMRHKDGHWVWLLACGKVTERDAQGRATRMVGTHMDITARRKLEEEIRHQAYHDALTDLPNRRLLMDRLQQARAASSRSAQYGALLFLDLDRFKLLNDTHGHQQGDLLLQQVKQRLLAAVREGDTVARVGGDEFVVMLAQLNKDRAEASETARSVSMKILAALAEPYDLESVVWQTSVSIGITLFVDADIEAEEILKRADEAMYQAKAQGRNAIYLADPASQAMLADGAAPAARPIF